MKISFVVAVLFVLISLPLVLFFKDHPTAQQKRITWWQFQSIDTMKYSRDLARDKLNDPGFDLVINQQIRDIALTGATHVALATPYDDEFLPYLHRWVAFARKYGLKVWYRGNWSGWEKWFNYPPINRAQHITKTREFILNHQDLFMDGDIFSACPECENGGPGDPRETGSVEDYRKFLIDEYKVTAQAFSDINRKVATNYNSMNADVAKIVMDKKTTQALGGLVVIDHYVDSPEHLAGDIDEIARLSGGKVILGEFGVPIPDINGNLTEKQQSEWLRDALDRLSWKPYVTGMNYWVNVSGSTQLWDDQGHPRMAVGDLDKFYSPAIMQINIYNTLNQPTAQARVMYHGKTFYADSQGKVFLPQMPGSNVFRIMAAGYQDRNISFTENQSSVDITLDRVDADLLYKLEVFISRFL
jgi:hypothetical protein